MAHTAKQKDYFPYLLLVPATLVMVSIVAYPLIETFRLSFTNTGMSQNYEYVGLANYEKIMSRRFPEVIARTFYWMGLSVALKMLIGTLGAVLLNAMVPGRALFRILVMPPWVIPIAIGVFIWGWMYNGQFGMLSGMAQRIGILDAPFEFLAYKNSAFMATIVTDVWIGVPMVTLYLLAAMQSISRDLYEAAWVDGASRFYRFRRITLPLIIPSIATMALLSAIATFNSFDIIWILTEGGPRGATTTMIIDTYKTAISRFKYGEGAARTVMIVLFLGSFTFVYFVLLSRLAKRSPNNAA
ncbi:MAG: sugar ABC transporter permease [Roseibium album]|uniref:Inner membrane ABC transporter permease protein YcjO n=1 Tax=Roseibium album TaxID=311410 RepID=A0A0M7A602_9HYPH|nr:sugar ABC transporter permease [Roseibium album]MBG6147151.1 multiple sugar transport system permease protein [Labrenzia sp. EL_142]MBG6159763.1 multiple sugar transport system permease protein [Labrenzia sp. EL_162]MBG6165653.1 multiple sugar transport system permease protein [Labrenzia sp. EL_195]MBG6176527.1 multiple sugar transport system permease protein [Labrenzia sp. EL_132]MBG6198295.1 multiple sugar transport system permease protein [Labrenzia sp. EL_159]MBG6201914.1 multiple suga